MTPHPSAARRWLLACSLLASTVLGGALLAPADAKGLPGAPENLKTQVVAGAPDIQVTWSDPVNAALDQVTGFRISVSTGGGAPLGVPVTLSADVHSAVLRGADYGFQLGHSYLVTAQAVNVLGDLGLEDSTQQTLYVNARTPVLATNPTNPLAGHPWGVYRGLGDPMYNKWIYLSQADKDRTALIAMEPKARFFVASYAGSVVTKVRDYLAQATGGDPNVLAQMTLFAMSPWEGANCLQHAGPTAAQAAAYRKYVDDFATGIGSARTAVVLQPDGPFARCDLKDNATGTYTHKLAWSHLIGYASKKLSALPHTSVYIEMGSADWFRWFETTRKHKQPIQMLFDAGVQYARGFALDSSHQDSVERQIVFGQAIIRGLNGKARRLGIPSLKNKHFVIDTSDTGQAFGDEVYPKIPHFAPACATKSDDRPCVALGVPPTTDVVNPLWHLCNNAATGARLGWTCPTVSSVVSRAATSVDGYLWIARPWLQTYGAYNGQYDQTKAATMVSTFNFPTYW